jgi:hypothetical protein
MLMPRTTRTVGTVAALGGLDGIATCKSQGKRSSETLRQCGAWYREFVTREAPMEAKVINSGVAVAIAPAIVVAVHCRYRYEVAF